MNTVSLLRRIPAMSGQLKRIRLAGGHRSMATVAHPELNSPSHCPIMDRTFNEKFKTWRKYTAGGAGFGLAACLVISGFPPAFDILGIATLTGTVFGSVVGIDENDALNHERKREQLDWYMDRLSKHN